jgi:hypothetical protein
LTNNNTRRIGKFYIHHHLLSNPSLFESNQAVFSKIIPLQIERNFYKEQIEYIGMSELFEPLEEGNVIPLYMISVEVTYGPLNCRWYHVKADVVTYSPDEQETIFVG